ncbi:unnamed protein product, partial [Mesorhabditis spiculigera]
MTSAVNSALFAVSRSLLAGSRAGAMPSFLSLVHTEHGSPRVALIFHATAAISVSFIGDVGRLINYAMVSNMLSVITTITASIYIRWTEIPVSATAIRYPILLHWLVLAISVALVAVPISKDPMACVVGFGLLLVFSIIYFTLVRPSHEIRIWRIIEDKITRFFQLVLWAVHIDAPEIHFTESEEAPTIEKY